MPSPHLSVVPPSVLVQYEGCFPRALLSKAPEYVSPIRGVLLRGAPHEPKDVFSRALFLNARGAVVSEGVLHVSVMGVAFPRALFSHARGALPRRRESSLVR